MVVEAANIPIEVFTPENADEDAIKNIAAIKASLASPETRAELNGVMRKYGTRALVIVPNQDEDSSHAKFLMYFVPGEREMPAFALGRLGRSASEILGAGESISFLLKPGAEREFARAHHIKQGEWNPAETIFTALDARGVGLNA